MFTHPLTVFSQKVEGGFWVPILRNPQRVSCFHETGIRSLIRVPVPRNPEPGTDTPSWASQVIFRIESSQVMLIFSPFFSFSAHFYKER